MHYAPPTCSACLPTALEYDAVAFAAGAPPPIVSQVESLSSKHRKVSCELLMHALSYRCSR